MTIEYTDVFPTNISNALTEKVAGIMVTASTRTGPYEVPVTWMRPDFELKSAEYPGIYLSYGPVTRAGDREHRGPTNLTYAPVGMPVDVLVPADMDDKDSVVTVPWNTTGFDRDRSPYRAPDTPVPYNVDFNIGVFTRNYQQNLDIVTQLQDIERIPSRFGGLEIPEDGTIRTLELLGGPDTSAATDEDNKRLIQTLYSVRVAAELSLYDVEQITRVSQINIESNWL